MSASNPLDSASLDALLDATGGDPSFLAEMIDAYLVDTDGLFLMMDGALTGGRADELRRAAHSLKSNSATFGAMRLSDLCRAIEERGRSGDLSDSLFVLIDEARAEYARVRELLQATRAEL